MEKKIMIYDDVRKYKELEKTVKNILDEANDLIRVAGKYIPKGWKQIETPGDFENLIRDKQKYFDDLLRKNSGIDLKASGGILPRPSIVADMFDLNYNEYQEAIKDSLSYSDFKKYRDFLKWDDSLKNFRLNNELLSDKKANYQVYASTDEEISVYRFWHRLCDDLNALSSLQYTGPDTLDSLSQKIKNSPLLFNFQSFKLSVDMELLYADILRQTQKYVDNE